MNEKNKNFLFGVVTAIAVIAVIGWVSSAFKSNDVGTGKSTANKPNSAQQANPTDNNLAQATIKVTKDDHVRGDFDAPVTIVEFSDFQCPFCGRFHETMLQIMDKYPKKVRWVYKHFPLDSLHPNARPAAEAAECASEQGKFWEFADAAISNQSNLSSAIYQKIANTIGLDVNKFNDCVSSGKYKNKIQSDQALGSKNGVNGTPGLFINGKAYRGALPLAQMEQIIDAL